MITTLGLLACAFALFAIAMWEMRDDKPAALMLMLTCILTLILTAAHTLQL